MGKRYHVILFILLVVGGIFNFGLTVQAEDTMVRPVEINAANFPDKAFRDYLLAQDFGLDERLSGAEMDEVTIIDLSGKSSIISLQGIEYFQNLTLLYCDNTKISKLDVRNNTNLEILFCNNTGISELDVRNNTNLEILFCNNTAISELDVRNNTNLEMLICNNTEISELDVRNNTNLQNLTCNNTGISGLDVRNNTNLKVLYCDNTGISELDVRNNTKLQNFYCNNTGISELDVSKNTNLQNLVCSNTEISELDVRNNTKLELLFCFNTGISELDVHNNTNLAVLDCSGTIISNLDISMTSIDPNDLIRYSDFSNCKTPVPLLSGNIIELSQLPGIDASKIVGTIENATLSENSVEVNNPSEVVSYTYDCGLDMKETFTLEISSYEISYDANDGSGEMESDAASSDGTAFTLPENSFTAPIGKQFKEWEIKNPEENITIEAGGTYTFTEATTVYAVWEPITYTVDFKNEGQLLKSQTVEYGESAEAPEVAEKTGYIYSWDVDFSKITENLTVNLVQTPITYNI